MEETLFFVDFGSFARLLAIGASNIERAGNVLALMEELQIDEDNWHCLAASDINTPNSDVQWAEVDQAYLDQACVPIDEETARRIHPALFTFLEMAEDEDEDN